MGIVFSFVHFYVCLDERHYRRSYGLSFAFSFMVIVVVASFYINKKLTERPSKSNKQLKAEGKLEKKKRK